ncbi:hypothetical protein [Halochromatium roseum]|uniref:hypothetical protein n=1 Tax=Halochromatium roseum TaxID=391920 RepID=UPI001914A8FF|nr:hypothetical protein [Halochromatium roseum]
MRDYKGSGSLTFRKRRRFPSTLVALILLLIASAIVGYIVFTQGPTAPEATAPAATKASSGRDVIPLKIPGQSPSSAQEDDS